MQAIVCSVQSGGVLDNLVSQFGNAAANWQNQIDPIVKHLFFMLFAMEFMWQLAVKKVFAGDIEKLWVFFFSRIVLGFFFAKYLVNVAIYREVIEYFANLGSQISGYSLSLTPGNNFGTLGPSEIISNFSCITDSIHRITDSTGSLEYLTLKFSLAIIQVLLFVVLAFMAFYLIKVILQAYFILYAGFILTGFAGSSWTRSFWQRYVEAVAGIAVKFLSVCFLLGVLAIQMQTWATDINTALDVVNLSAVVLKVLGSAIIMALLVYQLPEWASTTLVGGVNMKLGSQITSTANVLSGIGNYNFGRRNTS